MVLFRRIFYGLGGCIIQKQKRHKKNGNPHNPVRNTFRLGESTSEAKELGDQGLTKSGERTDYIDQVGEIVVVQVKISVVVFGKTTLAINATRPKKKLECRAHVLIQRQ